jgi:MFS transporter, AAHS family, 4-hydroxybenzoate transporter
MPDHTSHRQRPIKSQPIRTAILCGMVAFLDGFDLLAIGVAAPAMARSLHIPPSQLGPLFSAALFGLMFGAFGLGPIADRFGRRSVLIGATAMFGAFTLCTAIATTLHELLLFRFLAGIGLGGTMPSFISLATEHTPPSQCQQVVALLWTGFPLGGVIVGLLASHLVPQQGWRALFVIGGTLPLALSIVLVRALPESVAFLAIRGDTTRHPTQNNVSAWALFEPGRGRITVLLWASYFTTFLTLITASTWTPSLLERSGIDITDAVMGVTLFTFGSVIGTPLAGFLLARFAARNLLPTLLFLSALAISIAGHVGVDSALACLAGVGFCIGAASSGLIALAPLLYPTAIRSTAVGWATGWGRFGSFVGPLAIGALVAHAWRIDHTFLALGLPPLCAALFTRLLCREPAMGLSDSTRIDSISEPARFAAAGARPPLSFPAKIADGKHPPQAGNPEPRLDACPLARNHRGDPCHVVRDGQRA